MQEKFLLDNITINVSDDHRFGTDAFLLAAFAAPLEKDRVCDLCTGCGIIPLIFCKKRPPREIYGVELQQEAVELFRLSVSENHLEQRVFPILGDLRGELPLEKGSMDMVTVNPPYFKANSGAGRLSEAQRLARHEIGCNLEDVIKAASSLLKYGGSLKICHIPERLTDLFCLMRTYGIEPKTLTLVQNRQDEAPWLALVGGKKGGKPGLKISKPLVMQDENGSTKDLLEIYR